jgi:hypothetical protein
MGKLSPMRAVWPSPATYPKKTTSYQRKREEKERNQRSAPPVESQRARIEGEDAIETYYSHFKKQLNEISDLQNRLHKKILFDFGPSEASQCGQQ